MKRVVHVTTVHNVQDPRILHREVKTLQRSGFDVCLVAPHSGSAEIDGVPVDGVPENRQRWRLQSARAAYHIVRQRRPDVVHIHDPELIPVAYRLKKTTGAAVIYDMHEDYRGRGDLKGWGIRLAERWCFSWADHVILAEDAYARILHGADVPHTVVLNFFRKPADLEIRGRRRTNDPLTLLYAGVQGKDRGLALFLETAEAIRDAGLNWRFLLAGICYLGKQRVWAENEILNRELSSVVRLEGWDTYVKPSHMDAHFRAADIGLSFLDPVPNYLTSIPTKFYEYIHYGLPIVCSDFPKWKEFVEDQGVGATASASPDAVIEAVSEIVESPAGYSAISEKAATLAPQYDWSRMEPRLLAAYEQVFRGRETA